MVEPGNDFDDFHDDDPRVPLLPPEDRLWRHPSELGASTGVLSPDQALAARRRWLAATPSRASAGAAGLVGALLAAGVVLVGTHLTAWLTPPKAPTTVLGMTRETAVTTAITLPTVVAPELGAVFADVKRALVEVNAFRTGGSTSRANGVIISPEGYVVVPSAVIAGATSISVVRSDGEELVATVTGRDPETGVSVLHIMGSGLPFIELSPARNPSTEGYLLLAWRSAAFELSVGRMSSPPELTSVSGGPALLEMCPASLGLADAPDGALIINGDGQISGMVAGHRNHQAICVPGWLAAHVADQLISDGHVVHGWLGIEGTATHLATLFTETPNDDHTVTPTSAHKANGEVSGVRVIAVQPKSAAAEAGLERGDVIEAVNGHSVASMAGLQAILYLMTPSSSVKLEVVRGPQLSEVSAQLQPAA
ncbi:MAG: S1C family serine protease [Acidimicrobiales bacterium]